MPLRPCEPTTTSSAFQLGLVTRALDNLLWMAHVVTLSLHAVALANYADLPLAMREVMRVLRPAGRRGQARAVLGASLLRCELELS